MKMRSKITFFTMRKRLFAVHHMLDGLSAGLPGEPQCGILRFWRSPKRRRLSDELSAPNGGIHSRLIRSLTLAFPSKVTLCLLIVQRTSHSWYRQPTVLVEHCLLQEAKKVGVKVFLPDQFHN